MTLNDLLTSLTPEGTLHAPETWAQGRTLYGGASAALCYTAVRNAHGDLGPLRSAQFSFIGPAAGDLRFTTTLLRQGRSSTVVGADCLSDEGMATRATFFFGRPRDSVVTHDRIARPDVPAPDACDRFHPTQKPLPGFLARYDFRLAAGARPFEVDKAPEFMAWVRLNDGDATDPVATLLAMGDATPCAAMANFPKPAPLSTMSWAIDFHHPAPAHSGWHLIHSSSEAAADGYSIQAMRVFNEAGEPLVTARQVVALFI